MMAPLLAGVLLSGSPLGAAVIFRSQVFPDVPLSTGTVEIDLDGDLTNDFWLDVSWTTQTENDGAFLVRAIGSSRIAGVGGITQSFSTGDNIDLGHLDLLGSSTQLLTGGALFDAFGNFVSEGWGGCTWDLLGNLTCPPGGPDNQIDLFLVTLEEGVAWVDLDPTGLGGFGGGLRVDWGYLPLSEESFTIVGIPEPGAAWSLLTAGGLLLLGRRRRDQ